MSFKSLVNKLVKEGKSREAATKIAGKVANAKMKGAASGPTAKQKARAGKGSPAKNNDTGVKETKAQTRARYKENKSKRRAAKKDIRKGTYPENAAVKAGIALDSTKGSNYDQVLSSRATAKNKAKQEGTTIRKSKKNFVKSFNEQNKNAGNKERLKLTVSGKVKTSGQIKEDWKKKKSDKSPKTKPSHKKKQGSKSPTNMKKQGYNARLDDSLGAKHGKKSQSLKSRRDESEGDVESLDKRKFSGNKSSAQGSPAKRKDPSEKREVVRIKNKEKGTKTKFVSRPTVREDGVHQREWIQKTKTKGQKGKDVMGGTGFGRRDSEGGMQVASISGGHQPTYGGKLWSGKDAYNEEGNYSKAYKRQQKRNSPAKFQAYDQMDTRNAAKTAGSPMGMYSSNSPANMSGQSYDAKEAYNKDLSASARLHYLENNRADAKAKKGGHAIHKHMGGRK